MKQLQLQSSKFVTFLLVWVAWLGSEVRGQLCPPGQVTHAHNEGPVRCCLPVYDCKPDYFVELCKVNGTADTCKPCPPLFRLSNRTSSFGLASCQEMRLDKDCQQIPGPYKASKAEKNICFCKLERGDYYMEPQVELSLHIANCQSFYEECKAGEQPTLFGTCEPCPPNRVKDLPKSFLICRPQINCTAMRLETKEAGTIRKPAVCADPPPLPPKPPQPLTPLVSQATTTTTRVPDGSGVPVGPVTEATTSGNNFALIIVLVMVACLLLGGFIVVGVCGRRKGWFAGPGRCCGADRERRGGGVHHQSAMSAQDGDTASDNSCTCDCTDSCLTSSSKGASSSGGGGASGGGGGGGGASSAHHHPHPVPMLEGYMNGGKCPLKQSSPQGEEPEPLYSSLCPDSGGGGGGMASYKNTNGVVGVGVNGVVGRPMVPAPDFYSYPNKVHLPSANGGGGCGGGGGGDYYDGTDTDAINKQRLAQRQLQQQQQAARGNNGGGGGGGGGGGAREGGDFSETDPLLPNSDTTSSSALSTPVAAPALRGILRNNGTNNGGGLRVGGGGGGGEVIRGNRPNLSMLLSGDSSVVEHPHNNNNLPYLSQLVSSPPLIPPTHPHQQQQQQQQQQPEQIVHDLPQELQQRLLQQQQQQQQQQQTPLVPQQQQPEQIVNELPMELQQRLLQQQQQQQQQAVILQHQRLQQEGSTLPQRQPPLVPLAAPSPHPHGGHGQGHLNPSLVKMEELKPVMPLGPPSPGAGGPPSSSTSSPLPSPMKSGAAVNIGGEEGSQGSGGDKGRKDYSAGKTPAQRGPDDGKIRSESPARINPSQQQEVRGGGGGGGKPMGADKKEGKSPLPPHNPHPHPNPHRQACPTPPLARAGGARAAEKEKEIDEQTFRKQAMPNNNNNIHNNNNGNSTQRWPEPDEDETTTKSVGGSSGLGESLDFSSLSDEGRRSRAFGRSISEASRSVSPPQVPRPPSRSISSPDEKHRPFAVVKPMQSDQSLNTMSSSPDRLSELTQPLETAGRHFPLHSLRHHAPRRQMSQDSSDDPDLTRPKTPDRLLEDENEANDTEENNGQEASDSESRTRANFYGNNDWNPTEEDEDGAGTKDPPSGDASEG